MRIFSDDHVIKLPRCRSLVASLPKRDTLLCTLLDSCVVSVRTCSFPSFFVRQTKKWRCLPRHCCSQATLLFGVNKYCFSTSQPLQFIKSLLTTISITISSYSHNVVCCQQLWLCECIHWPPISGIFGYINYLVEKDRKFILDTLVNGTWILAAFFSRWATSDYWLL